MFEFDKENHKIRYSKRQLNSFFNPIVERFNESPFVSLSKLPAFTGSGVYGIFLEEGRDTIYSGIVQPDGPIYVGKSSQKGGRQGQSIDAIGNALRQRLSKHRSSLSKSKIYHLTTSR